MSGGQARLTGEQDERPWVDPSDAMIEAAAATFQTVAGEVGPGACAAIDPDIERIAWVTRPDELPEPKLAFLLEHWQRLAAECGGVPERSDVDILDLVPAIGNLMMLEAERDGLDAVYRVYGTAVADRAGRDWTGYRVSEMNRITRTPASLLYRSCYLAVFRRQAPLFTEHASAKWLGVYSWRRLILPLAGEAGGCSRFLVGNISVGKRMLTEQEIEAQQRRIRGG